MNEAIKEKVVLRLSGFGYTVTDADTAMLDYVISKIEQDIKNFCHIPEVPEELYYTWTDAVCADFLKSKLSTNSLDNVSGIVSSIREGDTTVSYSKEGTPEAQLLECISKMALDLNGLVRFRKLVW